MNKNTTVEMNSMSVKCKFRVQHITKKHLFKKNNNKKTTWIEECSNNQWKSFRMMMQSNKNKKWNMMYLQWNSSIALIHKQTTYRRKTVQNKNVYCAWNKSQHFFTMHNLSRTITLTTSTKYTRQTMARALFQNQSQIYKTLILLGKNLCKLTCRVLHLLYVNTSNKHHLLRKINLTI